MIPSFFFMSEGEFLQDGAGFIDLTGISIRLKSLAAHLESTPFLSLRTTTLDAMDAEGEISYYKATGESFSRIIRRRITGTGERLDEVIRDRSPWQQTGELELAENGASSITYVQIGDIEAARMIERITEVSP